MNSSLALNLEFALVAFLGDGRLPFASSVVGRSNPLVRDETAYGILGQYVSVPSVLVSVDSGEYDFPDNPTAAFGVTITFTSSMFQTSAATHALNASKIADEIWDKQALLDGLSASDKIVPAGVLRVGESFRVDGSAYISEFQIKAIVTSKD